LEDWDGSNTFGVPREAHEFQGQSSKPSILEIISELSEDLLWTSENLENFKNFQDFNKLQDTYLAIPLWDGVAGFGVRSWSWLLVPRVEMDHI
jgi:hypothetical protein